METTTTRRLDTNRLLESLEEDHGRIEEFIAVLDVVLDEEEHDATAFDDALCVLADELAAHFRKEEAWMRRMAYPGLAAHGQQHELLMGALKDFRRGYRANPSRTNAQVVRSFIDDWLVDHMEHADRSIEAFARCRPALVVG